MSEEAYDFGAVAAAPDSSGGFVAFEAGFTEPADDFSGAYVAAAPVIQQDDYRTEALAGEDNLFSSEANPFGDGQLPVSGNGAAPLAPPPPEFDDPRIAWAQKNAELLAVKDKEEAAAKAQLQAEAEAFLKTKEEARSVLLSKRKAANRDAEAVSNVAQDSVPKGDTPWERAVSIINFNAEVLSKDPFKELSRFKAVILEAKKANVPVAV